MGVRSHQRGVLMLLGGLSFLQTGASRILIPVATSYAGAWMPSMFCGRARQRRLDLPTLLPLSHGPSIHASCPCDPYLREPYL
jgi:hypothetical protein